MMCEFNTFILRNVLGSILNKLYSSNGSDLWILIIWQWQ